MFGIDSSELFIIGLVALLVIGPTRLPMAMKSVGQWVAKGRAMTRHVRTGFDAMVREAELEEMQKSWAKHNEAIMKATASPASYLSAPAEASATQITPPDAAFSETSAPESTPVTTPSSAEAMAAPPEAEAPAKPARKRAPRKKKPTGDNV